jgi:hypothetical protein
MGASGKTTRIAANVSRLNRERWAAREVTGQRDHQCFWARLASANPHKCFLMTRRLAPAKSQKFPEITATRQPMPCD